VRKGPVSGVERSKRHRSCAPCVRP
jgi:hypothetical protein